MYLTFITKVWLLAFCIEQKKQMCDRERSAHGFHVVASTFRNVTVSPCRVLLTSRTGSFLCCPEGHFAFLMQGTRVIYPASRGILWEPGMDKDRKLPHILRKMNFLGRHSKFLWSASNKQTKKIPNHLKTKPSRTSATPAWMGEKLQIFTTESHLYTQHDKYSKNPREIPRKQSQPKSL